MTAFELPVSQEHFDHCDKEEVEDWEVSYKRQLWMTLGEYTAKVGRLLVLTGKNFL